MGVSPAAPREEHEKTAHAAQHRDENENEAGNAPLHTLGHRRVGRAEADCARLRRAWPSGQQQGKQQGKYAASVHR